MRADQLDLLQALSDSPYGLNTSQLAAVTNRVHFSARRGAAALKRLGLVTSTSATARQSRLQWHWAITALGRQTLQEERGAIVADSEEIHVAPTLLGANSIFNWRP